MCDTVQVKRANYIQDHDDTRFNIGPDDAFRPRLMSDTRRVGKDTRQDGSTKLL